MNLDYKTVKSQLKELGYNFEIGNRSYWEWYPDIEQKDCNDWQVRIMQEFNTWYHGKLPKKKKVTTEYILKQIEKQEQASYTNYRKLFEQIPIVQETNCMVYPASYGIGIEIFIHDPKPVITKIQQYLDANNIQYKTEYSDAFWVYRFKLSQSQENLNQIQKIIGE